MPRRRLNSTTYYGIFTLGSRPHSLRSPSAATNLAAPPRPSRAMTPSSRLSAMPAFSNRRLRRFDIADELAMGEGVGDEVARRRFLQQVSHRFARRAAAPRHHKAPKARHRASGPLQQDCHRCPRLRRPLAQWSRTRRLLSSAPFEAMTAVQRRSHRSKGYRACALRTVLARSR